MDDHPSPRRAPGVKQTKAGRWSASVATVGGSVHLGTYDDEFQAGTVADAARWVLAHFTGRLPKMLSYRRHWNAYHFAVSLNEATATKVLGPVTVGKLRCVADAPAQTAKRRGPGNVLTRVVALEGLPAQLEKLSERVTRLEARLFTLQSTPTNNTP